LAAGLLRYARTRWGSFYSALPDLLTGLRVGPPGRELGRGGGGMEKGGKEEGRERKGKEGRKRKGGMGMRGEEEGNGKRERKKRGRKEKGREGRVFASVKIKCWVRPWNPSFH